MGCGAGRHAFELYRRGADVVAFDMDQEELDGVANMFDAMRADGEVPADASARTVLSSPDLYTIYMEAADDRVLCDMDTPEAYAACLGRYQAQARGFSTSEP